MMAKHIKEQQILLCFSCPSPFGRLPGRLSYSSTFKLSITRSRSEEQSEPAGRSLVRRCHFLVLRLCCARFCSRGYARVLVLQSEPARSLILEMGSALAVWNVTRTINKQDSVSIRKQSAQNRGEKFNHKSYRIILEIKECRWRVIFAVINDRLKPTTCNNQSEAFTL